MASGSRRCDHARAVADAITGIVRVLTAEGWQVLVNGTAHRVLTRVDAHLHSGIDWFDLEGAAHFGDVAVPLPELLAALDRDADSLVLPDGSRGLIAKEIAGSWRMAARIGRRDGERTRLTIGEAVLVEGLLEPDRAGRHDAGLEALRARLRSYGGTAAVEEPASFVGALRPYQRDGLRWFAMLRELGLGGCLADDMGLGKTVMVLAWLDRLRQPGGLRPSLIVVPRSVVFNWREEARRFTPALRVLDLSHAARAADYRSVPEAHVVLGTYGTLRRDQAALAAHEFEYIVLDEAQSIKNAATATAKPARALRARHRLALTGTPIENRLADLWSVLDFANPVLAARGGMGRIASAGAAGDRDRIARAVRPFILRRTKAQVARDLPPRTEQTISCELGAHERRSVRRAPRSLSGAAAVSASPAQHRPRTDAGARGPAAAAAGGLSPGIDRSHAASRELRQARSAAGSAPGSAGRRQQGAGVLAVHVDARAGAGATRRRGLPVRVSRRQDQDRQARVERFQSDPGCRCSW